MDIKKTDADTFMSFEYDDVADRPGQLLIAKEIVESQGNLVRKILQNVLVYRAEFLMMEGSFAYSGFSPLFDRGYNPNRRYQVWYDSTENVLKFLPDPVTISTVSN